MKNQVKQVSESVVLAIFVVTAGALGLAAIPTINFYGRWINMRPSVCTERVGDTGASAKGMSLECDNRAHTLTIEHINATAVVVCRCKP